VSASQKEKIYYDRREWAIRGIVLYICFIYLIFWVGVRLNIITGDAWSVVSIFVVGALPSLPGYSLRITVTNSKMTFLQGFFFGLRSIPYDEIASIVFRDKSKLTYKHGFWQHWFPKGQEFGSASRESQFVVKLNNSDYSGLQNHQQIPPRKLRAS